MYFSNKNCEHDYLSYPRRDAAAGRRRRAGALVRRSHGHALRPSTRPSETSVASGVPTPPLASISCFPGGLGISRGIWHTRTVSSRSAAPHAVHDATILSHEDR